VVLAERTGKGYSKETHTKKLQDSAGRMLVDIIRAKKQNSKTVEKI